jgi:hypothetical protein
MAFVPSVLPVVADIHEAQGRLDVAALYRELNAEDVEAQGDAIEKIDSLVDFLNTAPQPSERAKHDDECWKRHPGCLVEMVRGLIA